MSSTTSRRRNIAVWTTVVLCCFSAFLSCCGTGIAAEPSSDTPFDRAQNETQARAKERNQKFRDTWLKNIRKHRLKNVRDHQRVIVRPFPPGQGTNQPASLFMADRQMIQRLNKAKELIAGKKFSDAFRLLERIFENSEDGFFQPDPKDKSVYRSLKAEVRRLIGDLSPDGRSVYELQNAATAKAMLDDATRNSDPEKLAAVMRLYFHTPAGYEAAYQLAALHRDHARPLAAAMFLEKLRSVPAARKRWEPNLSLQTAVCWNQVGMQQRARKVLVELKKAAQLKSLTIAGKKVEAFENEDVALDWLDRVFGQPAGTLSRSDAWAVVGGNPARNAVVRSPRTIPKLEWTKSTVFDPIKLPTEEKQTEIDKQLKKMVASLSGSYQSQKRAVIPQSHPILVNGTVLVRTLGNVQAFDLRTGKPRWNTMAEQTLETLLVHSGKPPVANATRSLSMFVSQRIWSNATSGMMSSDGKTVYCVEDVGYSGYLPLPGKRGAVQPQSSNRLAAYDLQTGKLSWHVGGQKDDPLGDLPVAGAYFLGAPLKLDGRVYCLAEISGEISLVVLRETNRKIEVSWIQPLATASLNIVRDLRRRLSGSLVSYSDGVLVCPTGANAVVAVDLSARSLLWGHRFEPATKPPPQRLPKPIVQPAPHRVGGDESVATIHNGRVILQSRNSAEICCLDLLDGSTKWKKPLSDCLYVAGVVKGNTIVVGTNSVQAFDFDDGGLVWKKPTAIANPSGRGIVVDGYFLVPLSTSEIVRIDITNGRIVGRVKMPSGKVPGNLISAGGLIVSQSATSVEVFPLPREENKLTSAF